MTCRLLVWAWESGLLPVVLGVALGGMITAWVALWVEGMRKPKLSIQVAHSEPEPDPGDPSRKFVHLKVLNHPIPGVLGRILTRNPATSCSGHITFRRCGKASKKCMPIRWANSPQPFLPVPKILFNEGYVFNPYLPVEGRTVHCANPEIIDVALKQAGDPNWYGWSNRVWSSQNWKDEWKLEPGKNVIDVDIQSGDVRVREVFAFETSTGRIRPLSKNLTDQKVARSWSIRNDLIKPGWWWIREKVDRFLDA